MNKPAAALLLLLVSSVSFAETPAPAAETKTKPAVTDKKETPAVDTQQAAKDTTTDTAAPADEDTTSKSVYKWTDAKGEVHFSDKKDAGAKNTKTVKTKEKNIYSAKDTATMGIPPGGIPEDRHLNGN